MNTNQGMIAGERMAVVMCASNTWSLNVVLYGLLIDIMYRCAFVAAVISAILAMTNVM